SGSSRSETALANPWKGIGMAAGLGTALAGGGAGFGGDAGSGFGFSSGGVSVFVSAATAFEMSALTAVGESVDFAAPADDGTGDRAAAGVSPDSPTGFFSGFFSRVGASGFASSAASGAGVVIGATVFSFA